MDKENPKKQKLSITKGPSMGYSDNLPKRQMWEEIAKKYNGEFKIKRSAGNELEIHFTTIPHKKWEIGISVSDSRPLKFMIEFSSSQNFKLTLSWEDFIERVIRKFSKPRIQVGWQKFDKQYLIKSNRSDLVKKIITKEIQEVLLKYNVYSISYQTDSSEKTSELISVIQKQAGNKEMIYELIDMFKLLIDNLEKSKIIS